MIIYEFIIFVWIQFFFVKVYLYILNLLFMVIKIYYLSIIVQKIYMYVMYIFGICIDLFEVR